MKTVTLEVEAREETGKGPARRLRSSGFVPAVFYGFDTESTKVQVDAAKLCKLLAHEKGENLFFKLAFKKDGKKVEKLSIIKDMQVDTVKRRLIHVDFYEINKKRALTLDIPVNCVGTPAGVDEGGELQMLKRDLKVSGLPDKLPETIEIDVSAMAIGDSIKVADITLPEGVVFEENEDVGIVSVVQTRVSLTPEEEAEEAAEEAEAAMEEAAAEETEELAEE